MQRTVDGQCAKVAEFIAFVQNKALPSFFFVNLAGNLNLLCKPVMIGYSPTTFAPLMDPLSDVLSMLRPSDYAFRGLEAGGSASGESLRRSLARLMEELRSPQPGGHLMASHFAQCLLIEALRHHLDNPVPGRANWLYALQDNKLSGALNAIHAAPGHPWTVALLADAVGMSRSAFASRFSLTVGESPMAYVTRWRMLLACDRLAAKGSTISRVATSLGYESDSAFGAAFKRILGFSPRQISAAA